MGEYAATEGELDATGMRFAIVAARFNRDVTEPLLRRRARRRCASTARPTCTVVWVPGAFELPLVAKRFAAVGHGRRGRLPRRGHPGRDRALRVRRGRVRGRAHARVARHRRPGRRSACSRSTTASRPSTGSAAPRATRARRPRVTAIEMVVVAAVAARLAGPNRVREPDRLGTVASFSMLRLVLPKGSLERATLQLFEDADLAVRAVLRRRLPRHDRRPARHRRHGSCGRRRSRATSPTGSSTSASPAATGSRRPASTSSTLTELHYSKATARPIRMVLAVGGRLAGGSRSTTCPPGVRVHTEYPELTRRFLEKARRRRRDHRSRTARPRRRSPRSPTRSSRSPRPAGRCAPRACKIARHDPRVVHRADREPAAPTPTPRSARRWSSCRRCSTGALEARGRVLVKLNVDEANLDAVIALLPALKSPTVSKLFGDDGYAVETVVAKSEINTLIPALKDARRDRHHRAADLQDRPLSRGRSTGCAPAPSSSSTSTAASASWAPTTARSTRSTAPRSPTAPARRRSARAVRFAVRPGGLGRWEAGAIEKT